LQDKSITSEVKSIMAQTVLPFRYEVEKKDGGMTALAGLPLYLELAHTMGLPRLIEAHSIMKGDLAGGKLPSGLFGANAAWWRIMVLAFNLSSAMRCLVLGEGWVNRRMKGIRFWLINLPGRLLERGRRLYVRLTGGHPSNEILLEARRRMMCLCDSA
jgi:Transposase DDE domain group 1